MIGMHGGCYWPCVYWVQVGVNNERMETIQSGTRGQSGPTPNLDYH